MTHVKTFYMNVVHERLVRIEYGLSDIDFYILLVGVVSNEISPDKSCVLLYLCKPERLVMSSEDKAVQ